MIPENIVVRSVVEENNCAGKKQFFVSNMEPDESVVSLYRLSHGWMPPQAKLELASVAPEDVVTIVRQLHMENLAIEGDFIHNLSDTHLRDPLCRCGTRMVSDGFDIHCPNKHCALTLAARFKRLGSVPFIDFENTISDPDVNYLVFNTEDYEDYVHPFRIITQGLFWGSPGGSLEHILLKERATPPSLTTFLIPEFFDEFLMNPTIPRQLSDRAIINIQRFYGFMNELVNRRMPSNDAQDQLLYKFLWSLGIESLRADMISAMIGYEKEMGMGDLMVVHAWLLTHPHELVKEFGVHHLEASAIQMEVKRRAEELHDIFYHYSLNKADVTESFKYMMQ